MQPMLNEVNSVPGRLEQGSCLLNFNPFEAWSSRQQRLAKINYHRERLSKIYRAISERSSLDIEKDEEKILERVKQEVAKRPIKMSWPLAN